MPYLVAAGRGAARAFASAEAMAFYERALALLPETGDLVQARLAYEGLGGMLAASGRIPEALATYEAMLAAAEAGGDRPMQVSALNKIAATYALHMGQFQAAEAYLRRAERLGKAERDASGVAELSIIRCQMCTAMADFDGVIRYMGEVLQLGEELGEQKHIALALEHVSSSLMLMARFDEAWEKVQEALAVQRARSAIATMRPGR
jgi:tetratricopeptide (TPR) repeat protein